jgi:hypothetical protein
MLRIFHSKNLVSKLPCRSLHRFPFLRDAHNTSTNSVCLSVRACVYQAKKEVRKFQPSNRKRRSLWFKPSTTKDPLVL